MADSAENRRPAASYIRIIIVAALALVLAAFVYAKYQKTRAMKVRMEMDRRLISEVLEDQGQWNAERKWKAPAEDTREAAGESSAQ